MTERLDSLGRRIPQFNRSEAGKRGVIILKEKYGPDYFKKIGKNGGSKSKRGYFGKLKDEGRIEELKELSRLNGVGYFKTLKDAGRIEELRSIARKGANSRNNRTISSGSHNSIPRGE